MQTHATRRPARAATPARWQAALERAIAGGVQVRQLNIDCRKCGGRGNRPPAIAVPVSVPAAA